ncbi:MAG: glycosyltransferase family 4 protein, partial [Terriglobia bacterium]
EFTQAYQRLEEIEIYRHSIPEAAGPLGYLLEYSWALAAEFALALRVYHRTRFRVLHACNPPDTIFLIALFFRIFGVRFIFDHHDLNPELFEAKFGKKGGLFYRLVCVAERMTYLAAHVSIATNESYREVALLRGGMKPERVFVVRSTPDLSRMRRCAEQPELKHGRRRLVAYLGVMGPQEGVDLLLKAAAQIIRQRGTEEAAFVLIGGGTELPRLKALAAEMGLGSGVRFTGRLPDAELATYLSTADVCVAPDPKNPMNDKSTMNKILEYMAFARPVVLFDLTEGRRSAGEAALYARPNDPADLARQILILLDSESLRQKLGEAGLRRIAEQLNWEIQKNELLKAYEMVMASGQ